MLAKAPELVLEPRLMMARMMEPALKLVMALVLEQVPEQEPELARVRRKAKLKV